MVWDGFKKGQRVRVNVRGVVPNQYYNGVYLTEEQMKWDGSEQVIYSISKKGGVKLEGCLMPDNGTVGRKSRYDWRVEWITPVEDQREG